MAIRFPKLRSQKASSSWKGDSGSAQLEVEGRGSHSIHKVATVGRAPDSQICIDVKAVSRNHARIFFEGGQFWIKDLDSANGTSVNGKKITLQMLADQDKIGLGGVKAIFRCSMQPAGPAPVAEDPLEGSDELDPEGTPTGGLGEGKTPTALTKRKKRPGSPMAAAGAGTELQALTRKVESLQAENERLRRQVAQRRGSGSPGTEPKTADSTEVVRLKKLVAQLERALADSNTRIRNLQERLDRKQ
jgi:pSer/pThr/pTyr-binding forkhead associated (FHA) protein